MAEYARRTAAERTKGARARAIARGVQIAPGTHAGYLRGDDGILVPDPATAPAVLAAFQARSGGATIQEVRALLAEHGVARSFGGTQHLLESRTVLGEVHHGPYVNREAHDAIVPAVLFERVQRARVPRGRRGKSERLLARLGVAACGDAAPGWSSARATATRCTGAPRRAAVRRAARSPRRCWKSSSATTCEPARRRGRAGIRAGRRSRRGRRGRARPGRARRSDRAARSAGARRARAAEGRHRRARRGSGARRTPRPPRRRARRQRCPRLGPAERRRWPRPHRPRPGARRRRPGRGTGRVTFAELGE